MPNDPWRRTIRDAERSVTPSDPGPTRRGRPGHERGPAGNTRRAAEFDVRADYFILAAFLAAFFANFSFTVSFGLLFFDCLT